MAKSIPVLLPLCQDQSGLVIGLNLAAQSGPGAYIGMAKIGLPLQQPELLIREIMYECNICRYMDYYTQ